MTELPHTCPVCGEFVGISFDVHMILRHPETRQIADPSAEAVPRRATKRRSPR